MDSQIPLSLRTWFKRIEEEANHYNREEFLEIVEKMKKIATQNYDDAVKYGVGSESRLHKHIIENILNPLIGKLKYGKRN